MFLKLGGFEFRTGADQKSSGVAVNAGGQIRDSFGSQVLDIISGYIPNLFNFNLYETIRETIPFVDVAITKLVRLIGDFEFETYGNTDLKNKLNEFRRKVKVNHYGLGFDDFIYQMADATLSYGFAVGETVISRTADDVERLKVGDSKTFRFKKIKDGLQLMQTIEGKLQAVPMRDNIFYLAFDQRNGHPQGYSIMYSLPYPAQVLLRIEKSIENLYWRMGDPTFMALLSGGDKTNAEQIKTAVGNIMDQIGEAMKARRTGQVKDVGAGAPHGGTVDIKTMGSDFTWPEMDKSIRIFVEQFVAKTGLPPFMLGLSWSTTERMSKDQNDMIVADTKYRRLQIEPHLREIIDTLLILTGDAGAKWDINWNRVNLLDIMEQGRARYFEAMAMDKELVNYLTLINNSWMSEEEVTDRIRSDWRFRKEMSRVTGGNGQVNAKQYIELKKKQYARRIAVNSQMLTGN